MSTFFRTFLLFFSGKSYISPNGTFFNKESAVPPAFLWFPYIDSFPAAAYNEGAATEAAPAPHVPPQVSWSIGTTQSEAFSMYRIKTFNKISPVGLNHFDPEL